MNTCDYSMLLTFLPRPFIATGTGAASPYHGGGRGSSVVMGLQSWRVGRQARLRRGVLLLCPVQFTAGGLAFLQAPSPGPRVLLGLCVLFPPAVKIQENVGVERLSVFLAASQSVFSHLGGRVDG